MLNKRVIPFLLLYEGSLIKTKKYQFNPSGMVVYLMKAVQELSSQIDVLKSQISGSSDFTSLKTAVSGSN